MTTLRLRTTTTAPAADQLELGEVVVCTDAAAPGLYFVDADGALVFISAAKVP